MKRLAVVLFVVSIASTAHAGRSGVGGYMGACYTGSGFETGKVCETATGETDVFQGPNKLHVWAQVEARYVDEPGDEVEVDVTIYINDDNNLFQPEASLPVVVRLLDSDSDHPPLVFSVDSRTLGLARIPGERTFYIKGVKKLLRNSWGAARVDILHKLEVLLPGVGEVAVIDL